VVKNRESTPFNVDFNAGLVLLGMGTTNTFGPSAVRTQDQ
jgi:hypothetical protein